MNFFKQEMKGPTRPAPAVPPARVNRYSPATNWNDDPFGSDVFEPAPQYGMKKVPPPRPPPPMVNKPPDVPVKPSHFTRKPTVLNSLLSRKKNVSSNVNSNSCINKGTGLTDLSVVVDTCKVFSKCEPKNIQTGTLIDFSSPPSSPTFTTRSSSDGLSVDSFGSDATTSTNHHNANNGNASQAESGFEDDFDLYFSSNKRTVPRDNTMDDFSSVDPFSPKPVVIKPVILKKPVLSRDLVDNVSYQATNSLKGPTIIRAKPARPKPPDNSALLKNTFKGSFVATSMTVNTTAPITRVSHNFGDHYDSTPSSWESSPQRESSPPMPTVPPPPPPRVDDSPTNWPVGADFNEPYVEEFNQPYGIALFDYFTDHSDDLCFSKNTKINLIRRVDADWLYGGHHGAEGIFPSYYVDIKVPLPHDKAASPPLDYAKALYDLVPTEAGDLRFLAGDLITVLHKINDEWYFGECNGVKGQFPVNYVQMC